MKNVIVFRFSAMGDVALVMVALKTVVAENQDLNIIMVSREKFKPFFENQKNIQFLSVDFSNKHKGFVGLFRLFIALKKLKPEYILDLHQNLRTYVLKLFFQITKAKIFTLDKGRNEKKLLIKNAAFSRLKHVTDKYLDVFKNAGLIHQNIKLKTDGSVFELIPNLNVSKWLSSHKEIIGIAPFAQHKGKIWPLEKFAELIDFIQNKYPALEILIFGGGEKERKEVDTLVAKHSNLINLIGAFSLSEELAILPHLKLMISGDTSNMHLAAMSAIPVISIWGSTHSFAGFGAIWQPNENTVEIAKETLSCRPCSIYGNKPCARKDYACLNWIKPETVFERIEQILKT